MKIGDPIQMRVAGGDWLDGRVELVTKFGKAGLVTVDEGIPAPFGLLGHRQAMFVFWDGDRATGLHCKRELEFRCPPA